MFGKDPAEKNIVEVRAKREQEPVLSVSCPGRNRNHLHWKVWNGEMHSSVRHARCGDEQSVPLLHPSHINYMVNTEWTHIIPPQTEEIHQTSDSEETPSLGLSSKRAFNSHTQIPAAPELQPPLPQWPWAARGIRAKTSTESTNSPWLSSAPFTFAFYQLQLPKQSVFSSWNVLLESVYST